MQSTFHTIRDPRLSWLVGCHFGMFGVSFTSSSESTVAGRTQDLAQYLRVRLAMLAISGIRRTLALEGMADVGGPIVTLLTSRFLNLYGHR